ncbi:Kelch motif [Musa troglodytarum]|uniref:Kelch motif n=1 Tax=Musa troglodytarum TaxID=320322 RepID=A0A9E7KIV2_9LILI|nr:Kelch motif [Musa troglodytarum]URE17839.1 Kelch motif [Musa troglodytarum]
MLSFGVKGKGREAIKSGAGGGQKREGNELLVEVEADEALGILGPVVKGSSGRVGSKEKKITRSEEQQEEEEYQQQMLLCLLLTVVSPHIVDS